MTQETATQEPCLRCGFPEAHPSHDKSKPPPEGWHPFRGQAYLDALEDAILFAHEKNAPHQWEDTGMTILVSPSFPEKRCTVCGGINWGGKEDGVCFGTHEAESAKIAAHNRRAVTFYRGRQLVVENINVIDDETEDTP